MGLGRSKLPPIVDRDLKILLSYNLNESHIGRLWVNFTEVDIDCNGAWTVDTLYRLIQEPRMSMRAPIIDALFFMGDGKSEGVITFQDFLITFTSFCALSTEEILHLLFIIVDKDRNGRIEKEELLDFFSYVPVGCGGEKQPIFPVNNKNALDKFRGGKWLSLEFDGLAQLVELFPYIAYPAYHTQEMYRSMLLGTAFWDRLDLYRMKYSGSSKKRRVRVPGSRGEKMEVELPGKCTMQELLEYSRRKTCVHQGRRVLSQQAKEEASMASNITREKDDQIARCPLLQMIRNPRCMYYVPFKPMDNAPKAQYQRAEMELPDMMPEPSSGESRPISVHSRGGDPGMPPGVRRCVVDRPVHQSQPDSQAMSLMGEEEESEEESESESSSEESEYEESTTPAAIGDAPGRRASGSKALPPAPQKQLPSVPDLPALPAG
mmetsp:Transcript_30149/g.64178  ORF Transcript_30149/g.64178 Transcript_30149/m.64178 type:complete len:434 (+) Transcript_30149:105-1406(+)